jgi:DNA-binding NarL/FixJ family response regulator
MGRIQRILVADGSKYFDTSFWRMLIPESGFEMVGVAHNTGAAIEMALTLSPDIILVDLSHSALGGLKTIEALHAVYPDIPIIAFKPDASDEYSQAALSAGATICITKSELANLFPQMLYRLSLNRAAAAATPWNYD